MNARQEIDLMVKAAGWFGGGPQVPVLGKPDWRRLPPVLTNLADVVGTDTKNVEVPDYSYDDIDWGLVQEILRSPEAGELFSARKGEYTLDWGPARDAVKSVSPGFAKEMFSWKNLWNMKPLKESLAGMDRETAISNMDQILDWADRNENHKKILVGAVKNRNEQAAAYYPNDKFPNLRFPTWAQRRVAYQRAAQESAAAPATWSAQQ